MKGFENLSKEEQEYLLEVPVLITFLVAGADDHIDEKEKDWAARLIEFRSGHSDSYLVYYYDAVEKRWESNFQKQAAILVDYEDTELRNKYLSDLIAKTNSILPKLDHERARRLYNSFISFAKQIAQASGGFLGFGAVSPEEYPWTHLSMLENPEANQ